MTLVVSRFPNARSATIERPTRSDDPNPEGENAIGHRSVTSDRLVTMLLFSASKRLEKGVAMDSAASALLTDFYQLNMVQAYLQHAKTETAVFEFFVRKMPPSRGFLIAAGLEQTLEFLDTMRFSPEELDWLATCGKFGKDLIDYLAGLRFTGDVHAMAEGTVFFANEPILRITAPLPEAQLIETRLINLLHFQTLIASKAARLVLLAPGKLLVDFGLRRAHGAEAGLLAARASYLAGFSGTATMLAGKLFGIPLYGTMAHSFVQAFEDEIHSFETFAASRPDNLVLLIDTYDTEQAARKLAGLVPRLAAAGTKVRGVRLDSGDLIALSSSVRRILDEAGLGAVAIFASGGIGEAELAAMARQHAPIDGFGIGTSVTTSYDCPALDCAYKLQEYAGLPRRKRSVGKETWPGRKQVWRRYAENGRMAGDIVSVEEESHEGEELVQPIMKSGKRIASGAPLAEARAHAAHQIERLPEPFRRLDPDASYPVQIADALVKLADRVDERIGAVDRVMP
jgi:nicotinate phosphoribosyltransferase